MWENTNRWTKDGSVAKVGKKVWRMLEGDAPIFDENVAKYDEWTEGSWEYKGMRNTSGQRHGLVRRMNTAPGSHLEEACFKNDSYHGLRLEWYPNGYFSASIFQDGSTKGYMIWDKNWSEVDSWNKAYCLEFFSIADFKP